MASKPDCENCGEYDDSTGKENCALCADDIKEEKQMDKEKTVNCKSCTGSGTVLRKGGFAANKWIACEECEGVGYFLLCPRCGQRQIDCCGDCQVDDQAKVIAAEDL